MTHSDIALAKEWFNRRLERRGPDDCWPWTATRVKLGGKVYIAQRLAYIVANGINLGRREVTRTCKTNACCNPAHLEISNHERSYAQIGPPSLAFIKSRIDRFINVLGPENCWPWTASTTRGGYGKIWINGQFCQSHVLAYLVDRLTIDPDLQVHHDCDKPPCCNPAHLWQGTQGENMNDMHDKRRGVYGLANHFGKYPFELVKEVRERAAHGESYHSLATRFGLSSSLIYDWVTNRSRAHAA